VWRWSGLDAVIECLDDLQFLAVIGFPILIFSCWERGVFDPFIYEWIWMFTAHAFVSTLIANLEWYKQGWALNLLCPIHAYARWFWFVP